MNQANWTLNFPARLFGESELAVMRPGLRVPGSAAPAELHSCLSFSVHHAEPLEDVQLQVPGNLVQF
jgi:hypothetical protein